MPSGGDPAEGHAPPPAPVAMHRVPRRSRSRSRSTSGCARWRSSSRSSRSCQQSALEAKEAERLRVLAEKGQIEEALTQQRKTWEQKHAEAVSRLHPARTAGPCRTQERGHRRGLPRPHVRRRDSRAEGPRRPRWSAACFRMNSRPRATPLARWSSARRSAAAPRPRCSAIVSTLPSSPSSSPHPRVAGRGSTATRLPAEPATHPARLPRRDRLRLAEPAKPVPIVRLASQAVVASCEWRVASKEYAATRRYSGLLSPLATRHSQLATRSLPCLCMKVDR